MENTANDMELRAMAPLHEKILYAEKHKKNYDIYFSVQYDSKLSVTELDESLQFVMNEMEIFRYRVIQQGTQYFFCLDRNSHSAPFRSDRSLQSHKINVFQGDLLANYYIDEAANRIEFLMHHLIFDGESLYLFLDYVERAILQREQLSFTQYTLKPVSESNCGTKNPYHDQVERHANRSRQVLSLDRPVYAQGKISEQVNRSIISLAQKLRVTKFVVLLFVTALLARHQELVMGIVVSRKDKRDQADMIGNFTDVAPYLLQLDSNKSYMENAKKVFKDLFVAIEQSASLSYDAYRSIVGVRGFDCIVSYTKMTDLEQQSTLFSKLELGEYLVKYDNHIQFNEYHDHLAWEMRYDNSQMQVIHAELEKMILELDQIDLTAEIPLDPSDQVDHNTPIKKEQLSETTAQKGEIGARSVDLLFDPYEEHVNIFDSGISSFEIANIITEVHEKFGVTLSYSDMYATQTIRELKDLIVSRLQDQSYKEALQQSHTGQVVQAGQYYVCPSFMKAIFIDSFRFVDSRMYDVVYAYRLTEEAKEKVEKLKHAIEQVVMNNDVFFTTFTYEEGEVIGLIQSDRWMDLEIITVNELADMNHIPRNLQILGTQKLWEMKLIHIRATDEIYFYVHMHHMIVDHMAIAILLQQISMNYQNLTPDYTQYGQIASYYELAKDQAIKAWTCLVPQQNYPNIGKPLLASGRYTHHAFRLSPMTCSFPDMERALLTFITRALAPFFDHQKGYIGAVYHGRVVPNANHVIQSFARVLPIFFDVSNDEILQTSLRTAHQHQGVSIYDLNESGLMLEYPRIVYQTLYENVEQMTLFDHTIEFEGQSKFQIFMNLHLRADAWQFSLYIDSTMYDPKEVNAIVAAMGEGLLQMDPGLGELPYAQSNQ
ncbi:condensation domain-containing protein [Paenibacillus sp. KN14-4R]|uniref:condensation domain-containing protein n=1 Tax=Paenibacillus sp. KN14-4R TaxID=3445773 RepID=UPI003F9FFEF8